ncbi:MAG TPA: beta-N-acetylhexosaminidase, partial [Kofleriaceae bacterium]|nr:beta-N-acetylhexosaminidase [Kofleriaceae bacterium]
MSRELRRDVGQLIWVGFEGTGPPADLRTELAAGDAGAVVLFKRNLHIERRTLTYAGGGAGAAPDAGGNPPLGAQAVAGALAGERVPEAAVTREEIDVDALAALVGDLHAAAPDGDRLLVAVDQEGGRVQRIRYPATLWPAMLSLDRFGDGEAEALARRVGAAMGTELAALGFDIDFAPVLDVHTNPANPIIGDRAFATTAERAAARALAFAAGLADAGVLACGKHYPGHGDTHTDSHLELPRLDHDLDRLRRVELLPFARAAAAGLPMIMTAHVLFSAIDRDLPATLSRAVITDLLRGQLGYRGVVVSDDLDMRAIADHMGAGPAAVAAIRAGCDVLLVCKDEDHQAE